MGEPRAESTGPAALGAKWESARLRELAVLLGLVALALWVALPRYLVGVGLGDEGLLAYGAARVLDGELPNRDFVTLQPPLSFYAVALAFELFSPSLVVLRSLGLILHVAIALTTYLLARRITGIPGAIFAASAVMVTGVPLHNFVPAAVWFGTLGALAAVGFAVAAAHSGRMRWAVAAGVANVLALISRQDQGLYVGVTIAFYVGLLLASASGGTSRLAPARLLAGWCYGALALALPLAIYWAVSGALPGMFSQLVVFPATRYAETSSLPWPRFYPEASLQRQLLTALFYLPPAVALATGLRLVHRLRRGAFAAGEARVCAVLVLALLFFIQVLARSDIFHLVITLAPTFVLVGWWLGLALETAGTRSWLRGTAMVSVALVAGSYFAVTRTRFLEPPPPDLREVELARAGVALPGREADALEQAVGFLTEHSQADQAILVLPYEPMYYFLAQRRNPTRWNYLWPGDQSAEDHRELVRQAESALPRVAVLTGAAKLRGYAPEVVDYVEGAYVSAAQLRSTTFFLPKSE